MKTYLLTLIAAALVAALVGILSPDGERGGIAKHMKLLTSLFLICVLIAPLHSIISGLQSILDGSIELPGPEEKHEDDYRTEMENAVNNASTAYFTDMLTQTLASEFSVSAGDIRCTVTWKTEEETLIPSRVTVFLSGKAIWQDPRAIQDFVTSLLGCECITAIE